MRTTCGGKKNVEPSRRSKVEPNEIGAGSEVGAFVSAYSFDRVAADESHTSALSECRWSQRTIRFSYL